MMMHIPGIIAELSLGSAQLHRNVNVNAGLPHKYTQRKVIYK